MADIPSIGVLIQEASDPLTPSHRLTEMSDFPVVAPYVAGNPNITATTLVKLAEVYPQQVLSNPVLPLLVLENPDFPTRFSPSIWIAFLTCPDPLPDALLAWVRAYGKGVAHDTVMGFVSEVGEAGDDWEAEANALIATRPASEQYPDKKWSQHAHALSQGFNRFQDLPEWLLKAFARSKDRDIQFCVADYRGTPAYLLEEMARSEDDEIRRHVATNPNVPQPVLERMKEDRVDFVRFALLDNPHMPHDEWFWATLKEMAYRGDEFARERAAGYSFTPPYLLSELAYDYKVEVRLAAIRYLPSEEIVARALDENYEKSGLWFPKKVLASRYISGDVLAKVIEQYGDDEEVCYYVASNPHASSKTLTRLAGDDSVRVRVAVAQHPYTPLPREVRAQLSRDAESVVRRAVAQNLRTPKEILQQLATDADPEVRAGVAANHCASKGLLKQLAADVDRCVHLSLAGNSSTPKPILARLAQKQDDVEIILALAANPNIPAEIMAQLQFRPSALIDEAFFQKVYEQEQAGEEIRQRLAEQLLSHTLRPYHHWFRRMTVLASPHKPASVLAGQSKSPDWIDRYVIARHPHTPATTLEQLAMEDVNRYVRAAARVALVDRRDTSSDSDINR